jgi:hypothetical protein
MLLYNTTACNRNRLPKRARVILQSKKIAEGISKG